MWCDYTTGMAHASVYNQWPILQTSTISWNVCLIAPMVRNTVVNDAGTMAPPGGPAARERGGWWQSKGMTKRKTSKLKMYLEEYWYVPFRCFKETVDMACCVLAWFKSSISAMYTYIRINVYMGIAQLSLLKSTQHPKAVAIPWIMHC